MSEVEKMYENANIKPEKIGYCDWDCDCPYPDIIENDNCGDECPYWKYEDEATYPPFTAEKQLELIKLLQRKNGYKFSFSSTNDNSEYLFFAHKDNTPVQDLIVAGDKCYEEALAGFINTLWQDLTDQERTEIKRILEC